MIYYYEVQSSNFRVHTTRHTVLVFALFSPSKQVNNKGLVDFCIHSMHMKKVTKIWQLGFRLLKSRLWPFYYADNRCKQWNVQLLLRRLAQTSKTTQGSCRRHPASSGAALVKVVNPKAFYSKILRVEKVGWRETGVQWWRRTRTKSSIRALALGRQAACRPRLGATERGGSMRFTRLLCLSQSYPTNFEKLLRCIYHCRKQEQKSGAGCRQVEGHSMVTINERNNGRVWGRTDH